MKKKLLIILLSLTLVFVFAGCASDDATTDEVTEDEVIEEEVVEEETTVGYIDLTPEEAFDLIDNHQPVVIIDVSPAYDDGHIPGAISYPIGDGSFEEALPDFDMSMTYLIYCHGDAPAIQASELLVEAGFMNVYRLAGNYAAWVDAGYDVAY